MNRPDFRTSLASERKKISRLLKNETKADAPLPLRPPPPRLVVTPTDARHEQLDHRPGPSRRRPAGTRRRRRDLGTLRRPGQSGDGRGRGGSSSAAEAM
ncbi:hypothetical protein THAOC_24950, partial [Thalassiosira oceanica]